MRKADFDGYHHVTDHHFAHIDFVWWWLLRARSLVVGKRAQGGDETTQKGRWLRYSTRFLGVGMARVLLVEDEISLLLLAESVVQGLGHSTFSASNVVQAKALLDDPDKLICSLPT
jgi:hypothetical protein